MRIHVIQIHVANTQILQEEVEIAVIVLVCLV